MRRRNPGLYYLGVLIITWPFVLYWTYRLIRGVVGLTKEKLETVRVLFWLAVMTALIVAAWLLGVGVSPVFPNPDRWLPTAGINSAIASVGLEISILVILNRRLLRLEHKHHNIVEDLKIIFFSLLLFLSLPIMQKRLNRIIEKTAHASHGTAKIRHAAGHEHVRHA